MPEATSASSGVEEIVARARARVEGQRLYPRPLRSRIPVVVWPWFFRLPPYRRYVAYALWRWVLLSAPADALVARRGERWLENLLVHELCHIWQAQHHPVRMTLALVRYRYADNPFEKQARNAAAKGGRSRAGSAGEAGV